MAKPLKEIQAGADTETKLREFYQLSQKLAKLTKEVKAIQAQIGGIEEDIISELERAEDNALETKEFFARIQRKGYDRETPKYKEAFDFLLGKVNPALKKIAEEALEATKTISKVKASISVGQQGKPIMELRVWDKVKSLLRQIASRISGYNSSIEQALGQVSAKLAEVRYGSVKQMMLEAEGNATPAEAKKKTEQWLNQNGLPYAKLSAKTIGFSDLARTSMVFVTVHGWKPSPRWDELKQFAAQNGFRVQAAS